MGLGSPGPRCAKATAMHRAIPDLSSCLHLSVYGIAACTGETLDPDLDSTSPECADMPPCPRCLNLAAHLRREQNRIPS